eukprot:EG_transcript_21106
MCTCFATVALNAPTPFVRPWVLGPADGERHFVLKVARHPMVEVQEGAAFIPNDYELDGNHNVSIITGPSMPHDLRLAQLVVHQARHTHRCLPQRGEGGVVDDPTKPVFQPSYLLTTCLQPA